MKKTYVKIVNIDDELTGYFAKQVVEYATDSIKIDLPAYFYSLKLTVLGLLEYLFLIFALCVHGNVKLFCFVMNYFTSKYETAKACAE